MKPSSILPALAYTFSCLLAESGVAALIVTSASLGQILPDDTDTGFAHSLSVADALTVSSVKVSLNLSVPTGEYGWAGDLYAYLQHGSEISVLLNRPGRGAGAPFGYNDSQSISVTFDDTAANGDIRLYRTVLLGNEDLPLTGPLTGSWQPDGRATDPALVIPSDARTSPLSKFADAEAIGTWTLFVADMSSGGQYRFDGWSLEIDGTTAVPEPEVWAVVVAVGLLTFACGRRLRRI